MKKFFPTRLICITSLSVLLLFSSIEAKDWKEQAIKDSKQDRINVIFEGYSPNKLACDTTLRKLPNGMWVTIMLGGGDKEPLPQNRIYLSKSRNQGVSWSPMQPVDLKVEGQALVPTELMIQGNKATMSVATHDGKFQNWKSWFAVSKNGAEHSIL